MSAVVSRIDQAGRISVSAQQRRALGLESGSPIVITVVGNELRIRSMHAAMAELQNEAGQFLRNEAASVEAFIAQRHRDAEVEEGPTPAYSGVESGSRPELGPEQKDGLEPDLGLISELESAPKSELEPISEPEPAPEPEPERVSRTKPKARR